MSRTVNVGNVQEMYDSFLDIYPEFRAMCSGFKVWNWGNDLRKILINLNNIDVKIMFGVRKSESETWNEFSALLIPSPEQPKAPDPDKNAEVEISEEM